MAKKKNYRKLYEEATNCKVPKDFDVHHIDFNRENDCIQNLVAIPKEIHILYHDVIRYNGSKVSISVEYNPIGYNYLLDSLKELAVCSEIIHRCIYIRNGLMAGLKRSPLGDTYETSFKYLTDKIGI